MPLPPIFPPADLPLCKLIVFDSLEHSFILSLDAIIIIIMFRVFAPSSPTSYLRCRHVDACVGAIRPCFATATTDVTFSQTLAQQQQRRACSSTSPTGVCGTASGMGPASSSGAHSTASSDGARTSSSTTQVAVLEVWEHFKQFSTSDGGDTVSVRMQCPPSTVNFINDTVKHRHHPLQRAFAPLPPHSAKQVVERGWVVGSLKDVPHGSRRALLEAFLKDGWHIQSHNVTLSEREWLIQTTLFTRSE